MRYYTSYSGGLTSYITGGNPLQGAVQGLVVYFANHLAHPSENNPEPEPQGGEKPGQYFPAPDKLEGFPNSTEIGGYSDRVTWITKEGKLLQWDSYHGEVEVYKNISCKKDTYLGPHDANTGKAIPKQFDANRAAQLTKQISKGFFKNTILKLFNTLSKASNLYFKILPIDWELMQFQMDIYNSQYKNDKTILN